MRVRIKFRKNGVMRFVGHLDIMRYFQKAMRRANIDIAYSEGYSPHQIMSFAAPLGVGITSDGEYFDIEVHSTMSSKEAIAALNAVMADGMEITEYVALRQDAKKAMTAVAAADYFVYFKKHEDFSQEEIARMIERYYTAREHIEITKQTKKSERVMDVKPLIYAFRPCVGICEEGKVSPVNNAYVSNFSENNIVFSEKQSERILPQKRIGERLEDIGEYTIKKSDKKIKVSDPNTELDHIAGFFMRLCTGSTDNIKPELVLKDFYEFFGKEYDPFHMQIHRLEVYERTQAGLSPLYRAGDEIV